MTTGLVLGIDMGRVVPEKLHASYETVIGKKPPKDLAQEARDLAEHFQRKSKDLMECEDCGAGSPAEYDHCPFCGSVDEDKDSVHPPPLNGNGVAVPSVLSGARAKPGQTSNALARTEADLDARLANIQRIRERGSREMYALGLELKAIYDEELWAQRNGENGKPKYKTFQQFTDAEVNLHQRTVWNLMRMTTDFTEAQLAKHGTRILRGLLAAPKEERASLLEKVDAGELRGARNVEREVREIRERKGVEVVEGDSKGAKGKGRGKGAAKAQAAASAAAKAKRAETVTVSLPSGKLQLDAFARPLKKSDPPKRAKRLADKPFGRHELPNGVVLYVSVVAAVTGELRFVVEARREE